MRPFPQLGVATPQRYVYVTCSVNFTLISNSVFCLGVTALLNLSVCQFTSLFGSCECAFSINSDRIKRFNGALRREGNQTSWSSLMLVLRIREVPGSNLGLDTDYPD
jgi:hypothetical protein